MKYSKNGNWKMYWGGTILPQGAQALGTIKRKNELVGGALIQLESGVYVQGNAGSIRSLPQDKVEELIARSEAAAALGSIGGRRSSKAKTEAARKNIRKRWPKDAS